MSATTWLAATRPQTLPRIVGSRAPALTAIWVTTGVLAAASPGLVPGSLQDQLLWTLVTGCGWASLATASVALTPRAPGHARWTAMVVTVWLVAMVGGPFLPATETGFPPLLAVGPPVAALLTGILCLWQTSRVER